MAPRLRTLTVLLLVQLVALLCSQRATAVVLDWDAVTWTSAPPNSSNSYDVDPDPGAPGNDITVAVTSGTIGNGTVAVVRDTSMEGGLGTAQNTLTVSLDLTARTEYVTVTVTFSSAYTLGVNGVSFQIFDVDFANENGSQGADFQDRIASISALSADGVTLIAPTITTSVNNTRSGTGLNQVVDGTATTPNFGAGSGESNVTISFGTNAITSFTFTYGSGPGRQADPTTQKIGIHDITFTPVPEINPALAGAFSCLAATGLMFFHRARVKSRRQ